MGLSVKGINQYYGGSHILRDVSLEATPGKVTVVLGRNGVGKTSLLKSLITFFTVEDSMTACSSSINGNDSNVRFKLPSLAL